MLFCQLAVACCRLDSPPLVIAQNHKLAEFRPGKKSLSLTTNMIQEQVIRRAARKITNYIQKYATLVGTEKKEEVFDLFDRMHRFFPHWVIMTCPVMHPELCYASKNARYILEYEMKDLVEICKPENYYSFVYEDDRMDLHDCFMRMHTTMEGVSAHEHADYRGVLHYRFKKGNGNYIYLRDERATLLLKGSGNLYYSLMLDVTEERIFTGVKFEFFRQEETMKKISEYKPSALRNTLSKREKELVTLFKQGFSVKEIAFHLNISHYTVRNIKSRMFEKYHVRSTNELLNMTA